MISNPRAGETRSSARRTNPSPRCRRHGYEETSSSLATVALVASPYTWPRSSGRYRCRAYAQVTSTIIKDLERGVASRVLDVRLAAHNRLNSDITPCPLSVDSVETVFLGNK